MYNLTTRKDLIAVIQAAIEQEKWNAAKELIKTIQEMDKNQRNAILIEIKNVD